MNFKAIGTSIAVTTAVVGSALMASPVQAISVGSSINIGALSLGNFNETSADFNSFFGPTDPSPIVLAGGKGDFSGVVDVGTIKDLPDLSSNVGFDDFISSNTFKFSLTSISYFNADGNEGYDFRGIFSGGTPGTGRLVAVASADSGFYSGQLTAIPTPAFLPGLLAMGFAALRKGKGEASEETQA